MHCTHLTGILEVDRLSAELQNDLWLEDMRKVLCVYLSYKFENLKVRHE